MLVVMEPVELVSKGYRRLFPINLLDRLIFAKYCTVLRRMSVHKDFTVNS